MAKVRPVSSEDRFTLVEHLTELRSRIIACIAIFVVAFAVSYWQNGTVLKIVNAPLESAQKPSAKKCTTTGDSLEQSTCFDRAVSDALSKIGPVLKQDGSRESATESKRRAEALDAVRRVNDLRPTNTERKPVTLGVAEPFFQTLNIAMYGALVLSLPLLLYQLYAFLIPAFTSRERKAIVPLLIGVPFLFYAGVAFGYFIALPRAVDFLQNFNDDAFDILVQAKDYYKFVGIFLAGTGVVFQVPVVVIAISRLGILTPKQLRKQRGIIWIIAAVVAAVITPTPDAVTMLLMMAPLIVLFELSVGVAAILERRSPARGPLADWKDLRGGSDDEDDPDDPYAFDDGDDDFGGSDGGRDDGGPRPPRGAGPTGGGGGDLDDDPTFDDEVDFEDDETDPFADIYEDEEPELTDGEERDDARAIADDERRHDDSRRAPDDGRGAEPVADDRIGSADGAPDDDPYVDPEAPDPALQGDPAGPRLATDADPTPVRPEDEALARPSADEPTLVHPVQPADPAQPAPGTADASDTPHTVDTQDGLDAPNDEDAGAGPPPFTPPMPGSRRGATPETGAGEDPAADAVAGGPREPAEPWMTEADELDADDPFAGDDGEDPPRG